MSSCWTALFTINRAFLLEKNLADVTQGQADQPPAEGVNSISWTLRHLLEYRHELLREVLNSAHRPMNPAPKTLTQFQTAMAETQAPLDEALKAADLDEPQSHPAFEGPATLDHIVGLYFMHETYHLGQLGTARRLLGLPGAIKPPAAAKV